MDYIISVLIFATIWAVLVASLNLLAGFTGLYSLAHVGFMAIGAYSVAVVSKTQELGFFLGLGAAILIAAILGLVIGYATLRFRGHQYLVATLGVQVAIWSLSLNWVGVTRGSAGILGIPRPSFFGYPLDTHQTFLVFSSSILVVSLFILWRLVSSPFGRVLKAIRESDEAAQVCGKNVTAFRIVAFIIASVFAAVAGGVYAGFLSAIDPESFRMEEAIILLAIVIVGGQGNLMGSAAGTALWFFLSQITRTLPIPSNLTGPLEMMVFSVLLVLIIIYRPEGLIPEHRRR